MLWIGICEITSVATIGGMIGGCLMAYAQRQSNKFNMKVMEQYWNSDIRRLESKISTISVNKVVNNTSKPNKNNGYKHQRHFDQRG